MRIDKVYTKGGDRGQTSLIGGERTSKASPRIEAYGTVDEINATLGLVRTALETSTAGTHLLPIIHRIQNELFNLGAELATAPEAADRLVEGVSRVTPEIAAELETVIDRYMSRVELPPKFVIPGGTQLSAQLDLEDLREVVLAYQATCVEVIQRFDGYIAQYLGDGLLVYFGYPQAHEDDVRRAVQSGLGMVAAIMTLNTRLEPAHGVRLAVRLGIHTGLVVVGAIGSAAAPAALVRPDHKSIAVLPFADLSPARDQDYFCDGVADELITALRSGQTLEEIAEAQGVDIQDVQDAIHAARADDMRARIQQALDDGTITQEHADWLLEGLEKGFIGGPDGFGIGGKHGPGFGPAPEQTPTVEPTQQTNG